MPTSDDNPFVRPLSEPTATGSSRRDGEPSSPRPEPPSRPFLERNPSHVTSHLTRSEGEPSAVEGSLALSPIEQQSSGPRWWTVFSVIVLSLVISFVAASLLLSIIGWWMFGSEGARDGSNLQSIMNTRAGFLAFVVAPQLSMIVLPLIAAVLSPVPFRQRLSLVRGQWPFRLWIAAAAATPLVGILSGLVVNQFLDESVSLKALGDTFRLLGTGVFAIVIAVIIGLTPAICEELLFRGYGQTRLVRSFPPWIGIVVSSMMFAAFHIDPVHAIGVFPLGLYLGLVSFRSGSLFPAMLGHFVNNFFGVLMMIWGPDQESEEVSLTAGLIGLSVIVFGAVGASITLRAILFPPSPAALTDASNPAGPNHPLDPANPPPPAD